MENKNLLMKITFVVGGFLLFSSFSLALESMPAMEWELKDISGLRLEIFKRSQSKKNQKSSVSRPGKKFGYQGGDSEITVSEATPSPGTSWFLWKPSGRNNYPTSDNCRQEALRDRLWRDKSVAAQGRAVNNWVSQCSREIAIPFFKRSYIPLIKSATVAYDFLDNPHIRSVRATLPDGRVLTGFIAMKTDGKPRPFVIAKCGVFCNNMHSTVLRSFMMHLFDESPFHVLALSNNTGSDFQIENKALSFGGFDEGRQLYQIAQLVRSRESPMRDRISSVHVVGASLGGGAALYSGLYASANDIPGQESIQSVMATCPVVVLENSARRLFSVRPTSTVASFETLRYLREIFFFVPVLGRFFPPNLPKIKGIELYNRIMKAVTAYYHEWTARAPWDLRPFQGARINSLEQFWYLNDFRNYISQVTVPTMTIAADNDQVLKVGENTELLAQSLQKTPNNNVSSIFLKQGNHCAFAEANGWANHSMILREYILTHSPEAVDHWREDRRPLLLQDLGIASSEKVVETSWEARAGESNLRLKFKVFKGPSFLDNQDCFAANYLRASSVCYREVKREVPIKSLPWDFAEIPESEYEVTLLTRFANTRFSVVDKNGDLVVNSSRAPKYIKAWSWK